MVHPQMVNRLDPRLGLVISETATSGRFIIADIDWETTVSPNALTSVAYNATGNIKIYEPLGMGLFDYIRAGAYELGMNNHLDARFLLEIEILGENVPKEGTDLKYIWPIMLISTEVKGSVNEKGTEYNLKFIHSGHHTQTDLVQPAKDTTKISAGTLGEYFDKLQIELEHKEFLYAEARQKAGGKVKAGGSNPASSDQYHDEYHFILEPELKKFTFTSKGKSDPGIQEAWFANLFRGNGNKVFNITMRPGTTLIQQINKVLQSTNEISSLLPGKDRPQTAAAQGSSQTNRDNLKSQLEKPYQFFRIETFTVYKAYDYIRGRYAVKHVFLIYLADQPNMYNYPDEIDLFNQLNNKDKVVSRLRYYIQEGLLRKVYYHNYTGLNTDVLRVDLSFNQAYSLPSFPVIWSDRGETSEGSMTPANFGRRVSPFVGDNAREAVLEIRRNQKASLFYNQRLSEVIKINSKNIPFLQGKSVGDVEKMIANRDSRLSRYPGFVNEYNEIKRASDYFASLADERQKELDSTGMSQQKNVNTINNRSELLVQLKDRYLEDITGEDFKAILEDYIKAEYPGLRPRMEPDAIADYIDIAKSENERMMEKVFSVLLSPRDIVELDMEIFGDPYWLCVPNIMSQGSQTLDRIQLSAKNEQSVKEELNNKMIQIDPDWSNRQPTWGTYGGAQIYKGSPLFYFTSQIPEPNFTADDLLTYTPGDQVVGIYLVRSVINEFKDGKWTQKLRSVKDITIPSHVLPRGTIGTQTFEEYVSSVIESLDRESENAQERKENLEAERQRQKTDNGL
jgi:hypothetical protein